ISSAHSRQGGCQSDDLFGVRLELTGENLGWTDLIEGGDDHLFAEGGGCSWKASLAHSFSDLGGELRFSKSVAEIVVGAGVLPFETLKQTHEFLKRAGCQKREESAWRRNELRLKMMGERRIRPCDHCEQADNLSERRREHD